MTEQTEEIHSLIHQRSDICLTSDRMFLLKSERSYFPSRQFHSRVYRVTTMNTVIKLELKTGEYFYRISWQYGAIILFSWAPLRCGYKQRDKMRISFSCNLSVQTTTSERFFQKEERRPRKCFPLYRFILRRFPTGYLLNYRLRGTGLSSR